MKIDTQPQEDHQVKLTVEVEAESLEAAKKKAANKIAKKVKIPGFRPGKAPYSVILRQVGESKVLEDALDILLEDIYPKVLEEAEVTPYGPGSMQNIASMDPPTFEFLVPLAPLVKLGDYHHIRIDPQQKPVSEEDIDQVIENLRNEQAVIEPEDRPAQEADIVYIALSGERENPKEGEEKTLFDERKLPVVIEKENIDSASEWPFPEFSRHLIGMQTNDEKTVQYKFPKDYEYKELQGTKAVYQIKIEDVKARILPPLDQDFVKSLGEFETLDDLKKDIKEKLETRNHEESISDHEDKIIDKILEDADIKYPPQMLQDEIDSLMSEIKSRLDSQGLNLDMYLKSRGLENQDQLRDEFKPTAESRLKRALALMEVSQQDKITVPQEDIQARAREMIAHIHQYYPESDARRLTTGQPLQNMLSRITSNLIIDKTLEHLRKIAQGEVLEEPVKDETKKQDKPVKKSPVKKSSAKKKTTN